MPESENIYKGAKLKFKGVYDLKLMYKKLYEWLQDEGFSITEKYYMERVKPFGKILEFEWYCKQSVDEYFEQEVLVKFFIIGANEVEVEKDGEQMKLTKSELEIEFTANLIRNVGKKVKFADDSFLRKIYEEHFMKDEIDHQRIELYKETHDLMSQVKNFINLYQFQ